MKNSITAKIETITPDMAVQWLRKNHYNRPLKSKFVNYYQSIIERGEWQLNGEAIKFDNNNNLIDGQHRLQAVVSANIAIESFVIRGLPAKVFDTLDAGNSRRSSDVLSMNGYKFVNVLAPVINMLHCYRNSKGTMRGLETYSTKPTMHQVIEMAEKEIGLDKSVSFISSMKNSNKAFSPSASAFCHYLFAKENVGLADNFFLKLYNGYELREGEPVTCLRELLIDNKISGLGYRRNYVLAFIITAWNATREGRKLYKINYDSDGSFPQIGSGYLQLEAA